MTAPSHKFVCLNNIGAKTRNFKNIIILFREALSINFKTDSHIIEIVIYCECIRPRIRILNWCWDEIVFRVFQCAELNHRSAVEIETNNKSTFHMIKID